MNLLISNWIISPNFIPFLIKDTSILMLTRCNQNKKNLMDANMFFLKKNNSTPNKYNKICMVNRILKIKLFT